MICQNCHANVDNDLVFCTNCGSRLFEAKPAEQTVLLNSDTAKTSVPVVKKTGSRLKWLALIIGLIALPVSLGIIYILTKPQDSAALEKNSVKPSPANRKTNSNTSNQPANVYAANTNANETNVNTANQNVNTADKPASESQEIFNDRIEIAAGEHLAYPFTIADDSDVIGNLKTLQGEPVHGYFYLQTQYDEHFPDETYKVSSFEGKSPEVKQRLVGGDYVLIFLNKSEKPVVIKGLFTVKPAPKNE